MPIRNFASVAVASLLALSAIHAQQVPQAPQAPVNVTGRWIGRLTPQTNGESKRTENPLVILKQEGDVVTGTVGPEETQRLEIAKGKLTTTKDGTTLTFELTRGTMFMQFNLKYVDGKFKGEAKAERDGQKMLATFDLERAK